MKKILLIFGIVIFLVTNVHAIGVSEVSPTSLELLPGESGRFVFQIQSVVAPTSNLDCTYGVLGTSNLEVEFDQDNSFIPAGEIRDVLATVTVPDNMALGTYSESFCVSCKPGVEISPTGEPIGGASAVSFNTCGLEVRVDVVSERTRTNMPLPPKPEIFPTYLLVLIIVGIVILIAGTWSIWNYAKKKKKKK